MCLSKLLKPSTQFFENRRINSTCNYFKKSLINSEASCKKKPLYFEEKNLKTDEKNTAYATYKSNIIVNLIINS